MLLIRRARIIKKAAGKTGLAATVIREHYKPGDRWLIYCDDLDQLTAVRGCLELEGVKPLTYHSQMDGARNETLRWLETEGGVLIAIRCLDEGVDLPCVSNALILASSRNPREFVQRRGRVLRSAPGKALAFVHDAIVVPPQELGGPDSFAAGELARAVQFAAHADNPSCGADLTRIAVDLGIDLATAGLEGLENDEED